MRSELNEEGTDPMTINEVTTEDIRCWRRGGDDDGLKVLVFAWPGFAAEFRMARLRRGWDRLLQAAYCQVLALLLSHLHRRHVERSAVCLHIYIISYLFGDLYVILLLSIIIIMHTKLCRNHNRSRTVPPSC